MENGVGVMHIKDGIVVDIREQLENLEAFKALTQSHPTPFVITAGKDVTITKEARHHSSQIEDLACICAMAVVVQNLAYRLVADFYYRVNKPRHPYKVFNDEKKAIEWCRQYVVEKQF